ncbi:hypothetical protein EBT31_06075 [bacterium]|nr:hypothetical protein [bacterium]
MSRQDAFKAARKWAQPASNGTATDIATVIQSTADLRKAWDTESTRNPLIRAIVTGYRARAS